MGAINVNGSCEQRYNERHFETRAKVQTFNAYRDKAHFPVQADTIIFINRGQHFLLIDEQFIVKPGGYFKEKNISHDYKWRFVTNANPPTADGTIVLAGNNVKIRVLNGCGQSDSELSSPAEIATGDISVSTTPATATPATMDFDYTTSGFTIAAGKKRVRIYNLGGTVGGGAFANITVNGKTLYPDGIPLEFPLSGNEDNTAANSFATSPALTVVNAGGAMVRWETEDL